MKDWETEPERFGHHHVYPPGDVIAHEVGDGCWCGPECVPVERDDGSIGFLYVHHSVRGHELDEIPKED